MPKQTLQQRFHDALIKRGSTLVEKRRKYWIMTRVSDPAVITYYFLGNSGSIRQGRIYSDSVPIRDSLKRELLHEPSGTSNN